jgi:hypothetical protein
MLKKWKMCERLVDGVANTKIKYARNQQCYTHRIYYWHIQIYIEWIPNMFLNDNRFTCRLRKVKKSTQSRKLKGTQDWEFFWLRFWNLRYFFVSYVKILRFYKKIFWLGHYWEVRFFRVVLGLRGMKINFELGPKNFFFFFNFGP